MRKLLQHKLPFLRERKEEGKWEEKSAKVQQIRGECAKINAFDGTYLVWNTFGNIPRSSSVTFVQVLRRAIQPGGCVYELSACTELAITEANDGISQDSIDELSQEEMAHSAGRKSPWRRAQRKGSQITWNSMSPLKVSHRKGMDRWAPSSRFVQFYFF